MLPIVDALAVSELKLTNLSIGFSAKLTADLNLCPPLITITQGNTQVMTTAPALEDRWRAVWTDQSDDAAAIFARGLGSVDTCIALYDAPFEDVLMQELAATLGLDKDVDHRPRAGHA